MQKIQIIIFMAVVAISIGCKKKLPANDAVKADLKNYLTVEMPRHAELLKLLGAVS